MIVTAECVICGKSIKIDVDEEGKINYRYQFIILDDNNNVLVYGFVCEECVNKLMGQKL